MSFERGYSRDTIVSIIELDLYCIECQVWSNKAAEGFYGFSRGHKWARWKNKETDSMTFDAS
jgi:hypothetical protein